MNTILGIANLIVTAALAILTYLYVRLTNKLASAAQQQYAVSANPTLVAKVDSIHIGKKFEVEGYDLPRQQLSIRVEASNLGNAPAISIQADAEIHLLYTEYRQSKLIPTRFDPEFVPYLVSDSAKPIRIDLAFGNEAIVALLRDMQECERLNFERIERNPSEESYKEPFVRLIFYYSNNLRQQFKSSYEFHLGIWHDEGGWSLPDRDEDLDILPVYVPRPKFEATLIAEEVMQEEIAARNKLRSLSGW